MKQDIRTIEPVGAAYDEKMAEMYETDSAMSRFFSAVSWKEGGA